jgi:hypothetical protein
MCCAKYAGYDKKEKGKTVSVLNPTPDHENIWRRQGTVPHILNLSTRWKGVVRFIPGLYPWQKSIQYPLDVP